MQHVSCSRHGHSEEPALPCPALPKRTLSPLFPCSYHFDHFLGMFGNRLPELVNSQGFEIRQVEERPGSDDAPPTWVVTALVTASDGQQQGVEFQLRRKMVGARKGALMTYMLRKVDT